MIVARTPWRGGTAARIKAPNAELRRTLHVAMLLVFAAPQAHAQVAGRVSIESQVRNRGYAVADAEPAIVASASYDDRSGAYANATLITGVADDTFGVAGFQASVGYAANVGHAMSVDGGILQTSFARTVGGPLDLRYTELYGGLTVRGVTARAYYSPNYFQAGRHTLYAELEGNARLPKDFRLNVQVGALTYLSVPPRYAARTRYDWRATVSRNLGRFEVFGRLSGRWGAREYYQAAGARTVLSAGAAITF